MEKIIELAHNLGVEIANSKEIMNLEQTKNAYEKDEILQGKLSEYETERKLLADEFNKDEEEQNITVIENLKNRLDELGRDILSNPLYAAFNEAQKAMNDLMTNVNDEIKFCITGERPEHCTHDCSTCGGCH